MLRSEVNPHSPFNNMRKSTAWLSLPVSAPVNTSADVNAADRNVEFTSTGQRSLLIFWDSIYPYTGIGNILFSSNPYLCSSYTSQSNAQCVSAYVGSNFLITIGALQSKLFTLQHAGSSCDKS